MMSEAQADAPVGCWQGRFCDSQWSRLHGLALSQTAVASVIAVVNSLFQLAA
jgi:hypothetical protein